MHTCRPHDKIVGQTSPLTHAIYTQYTCNNYLNHFQLNVNLYSIGCLQWHSKNWVICLQLAASAYQVQVQDFRKTTRSFRI